MGWSVDPSPCFVYVLITISEPHYLLFYSADCKYTAVIRQRLEMPHFSFVTKIFTTQRLTRGKSVLRLFDIPPAFINKTLITLDFKSNETINKTKRNVSIESLSMTFTANG